MDRDKSSLEVAIERVSSEVRVNGFSVPCLPGNIDFIGIVTWLIAYSSKVLPCHRAVNEPGLTTV